MRLVPLLLLLARCDRLLPYHSSSGDLAPERPAVDSAPDGQPADARPAESKPADSHSAEARLDWPHLPVNDRGSLPDVPRPADLACSPGTIQKCGNCNLGTQTCLGGVWEPCMEAGCAPGAKRPCGNCNKGTQTCLASCTWGICQNQPCAPGSKLSCGLCGEKVCSTSCTWSACSKNGLKVVTGLCISSNPCGTGLSLCQNCWGTCDAAGNITMDPWCAGACTTCSQHQECP